MADYTLSAKITGDSSSLEKSFKSAQSSLTNFTKATKSIGSAASDVGKSLLPISLAAGGVEAAVGKMAFNFQDSMANINTLLDNTSNLKGYETSIKSLSNETGISLDTMSQGMYQAISSLGDGGAETESIFDTMAKSAKAGGADVSDSVSLISAGMKGYNSVSGETAQKISDLAFETAKLGVTTFPEMAKSMQPLFPLSNSLNISYEELFGSMATLTGVTGNTAEVSTQLKAVFSNLMSPTDEMAALMQKYGYSNAEAMLKSEGLSGTLEILKKETGGQSDKLAELFGSTEAITAVTALTGSQFDTFKDKLASMGDATGATSAAYAKLETDGDKVRIAFNQIKNAGEDLGESMISSLAPMIESVSQKVQSFTKWFVDLDDGTKRTIVVILGITAAIAPLLMGFGALMSSVSKISGGIGVLKDTLGNLSAKLGGISGPTGIAIAAVVALVAAFAYLMSTNEGFRDSIMSAVDTISSAFAPVLQTLGTVLQSIGGTILSVITGALNTLAPALSAIATAVANLMAAIAPLINQLIAAVFPIINQIISVISSAVSSVMPTVVSILDIIAGIIQTLTPIIQNILTVIVQVVSNIIVAIMPIISAVGNVIQAVMSVVLPIIQFIAEVIARIVQTIAPIISRVTEIFSEVFSVVSGVFSNIASFIGGVINTVSGVISAISGVVSSVFGTIYNIVSSIMGTVGSIISGVFDGIQNAWSGLTGFVSGVFNGIGGAVQDLVNQVKGFVNGVIGGINGAIGIINKIPGVSIGAIPYLAHGTPDWPGGFAYMNEGGRGELTYLPNGSQVIPHDISVQYAKEAARQSRTTESSTATTIVRQGDTINFNQPIKNASDTYRGYKRAREVLAYE